MTYDRDELDLNTGKLDQTRAQVLDRMERGRRIATLGIVGAATVEALLIAGALLLVDWSNRLQILVFLLALLSSTIVVFGLLALSGHVTRSTDRILAVLDAARR